MPDAKPISAEEIATLNGLEESSVSMTVEWPRVKATLDARDKALAEIEQQSSWATDRALKAERERDAARRYSHERIEALNHILAEYMQRLAALERVAVAALYIHRMHQHLAFNCGHVNEGEDYNWDGLSDALSSLHPAQPRIANQEAVALDPDRAEDNS